MCSFPLFFSFFCRWNKIGWFLRSKLIGFYIEWKYSSLVKGLFDGIRGKRLVNPTWKNRCKFYHSFITTIIFQKHKQNHRWNNVTLWKHMPIVNLLMYSFVLFLFLTEHQLCLSTNQILPGVTKAQCNFYNYLALGGRKRQTSRGLVNIIMCRVRREAI